MHPVFQHTMKTPVFAEGNAWIGLAVKTGTRVIDYAPFLQQLWLCGHSRSHCNFGIGGPDQASAAVSHAKAQVIIAGFQVDRLLAWKRILHHPGKRVWLQSG